MCGFPLGLRNRNVQFPARKGTAKTPGQAGLAVRIQAAPCWTQAPVLGFVCVAATAAQALPEALHPRDVGSPCFKILEAPSKETTFILVSGRSLPFSLLIHSHRAESGNREAFESLANPLRRG